MLVVWNDGSSTQSKRGGSRDEIYFDILLWTKLFFGKHLYQSSKCFSRDFSMLWNYRTKCRVENVPHRFTAILTWKKDCFENVRFCIICHLQMVRSDGCGGCGRVIRRLKAFTVGICSQQLVGRNRWVLLSYI